MALTIFDRKKSPSLSDGRRIAPLWNCELFIDKKDVHISTKWIRHNTDRQGTDAPPSENFSCLLRTVQRQAINDFSVILVGNKE
jgi:hypothetical protein